MDESLFSLDVPAGYTVQRLPVQLDLSKKPISCLVETLRWVAEESNGDFPPTSRGEEGIDGILQRSAKISAEKHGRESHEEMFKRVNDLAMKLGETFGFLLSLSPDNDWHYAGKNVNLNRPDRAIYWYRPHKASTTYEVLYADLSIKELPSEEAPKAPRSVENPKHAD